VRAVCVCGAVVRYVWCPQLSRMFALRLCEYSSCTVVEVLTVEKSCAVCGRVRLFRVVAVYVCVWYFPYRTVDETIHHYQNLREC